jgi:hypothetical protein
MTLERRLQHQSMTSPNSRSALPLREQLIRSCRASAIVLAILVGCDRSQPPSYPVSGSVRFSDGQPVRFGIVEFDSREPGPSPRAKLDDHGRFSLGTFAARDGAPAGEYRVIIVQHFDAPPTVPGSRGHSEPTAHQSSTHSDARVASEYADYATSPLRATVKSDGENKFEFVVRHPRRKLPSSP